MKFGGQCERWLINQRINLLMPKCSVLCARVGVYRGQDREEVGSTEDGRSGGLLGGDEF